ncbi:MAG: hypothetical protein ACYTGH_12520, partial [Planctomycetota bacterium]
MRGLSLVLVLLVCCSSGRSETVLGLHNVGTADEVNYYGARAVRLIARVDTLRAAMAHEKHWFNRTKAMRLKQLHASGVKIIVTVSHYVEKDQPLPGPGTEQRDELFGILDFLLHNYGSYIDVLSLDNEPT